MATDTLARETCPAKPTDFEILYAAWRHAKAEWEVAQYAPDNVGKDLPHKIDTALCERSCDTLNAFLLHPASDPRELLRKLRVFRDEEIHLGWFKAPQIVDQLVRDAHALAFPGRA